LQAEKSPGPHGQLSCAVPDTKTAVPGIGISGPPLGAFAVIVAVPEAPGTHCPRPLLGSTVTIAGADEVQMLTVSGVTGLGGALKMPVALNDTWPLAKSLASAIAGATLTDCSTRVLVLFMAEQPRTCSRAKTLAARDRVRSLRMGESSKTGNIGAMPANHRWVVPRFLYWLFSDRAFFPNPPKRAHAEPAEHQSEKNCYQQARRQRLAGMVGSVFSRESNSSDAC
jgi:hypothetical protein